MRGDPMAALRPPLAVYVTGIHELACLALRALCVAHGRPPNDNHSVLVAERHEVHLQRNVHRDHACACAVLVVPNRTPIDPLTRLAALHACREGVHRFILVLQHLPHERPDTVEREARELLMTLGVDGDAVPAIQSVLMSFRMPEHVALPIRAILAALDDLPAFLAPAPSYVTPPSLAREGALLTALRPMFAPATLLERVPATFDETAALRDGGGGSHMYGAPYLDRDEPWPHCERCEQAMGCLLQLDSRDDLRGTAPHGLFVIFACHTCTANVVRHHPSPQPTRRRPDPPEDELFRPMSYRSCVLHPRRIVWQLPRDDVFAGDHPWLAARLKTLTGEPSGLLALARAIDAEPSGDRFGGHFGGRHEVSVAGEALTPTRCPICQVPLAHLATVAQFSLWTCREHPTSAELLLLDMIADEEIDAMFS